MLCNGCLASAKYAEGQGLPNSWSPGRNCGCIFIRVP